MIVLHLATERYVQFRKLPLDVTPIHGAVTASIIVGEQITNLHAVLCSPHMARLETRLAIPTGAVIDLSYHGYLQLRRRWITERFRATVDGFERIDQRVD